jgi:hypothetical protein
MGNGPADFLDRLFSAQPAFPFAGVSARTRPQGAHHLLVPAVHEVQRGGIEDAQDCHDDQGIVLCFLVLVVPGQAINQLTGKSKDSRCL